MDILIRRPILFVLAAILPVGCGYDDFDDASPADNPVAVPNTDIGFVRSLCGDAVYNVTEDMVIGGYVTANDRSGNIYRSFFIEDGTGGAEIRAGMYSLHNVYTTGRYVSVKLQGLAVNLYNGVLQVGISPSEGYNSADYIDSWAGASDYLFPSGDHADISPMVVTPSGLLPEHCGRLAKLENMKLVREYDDEEVDATLLRSASFPVPLTWAYPRQGENQVPQAVYRYFEDASGQRIAVYTSGYASFAGRTIPEYRVSLTGILSYGKAAGRGAMFILRLRDIDDVSVQVYNEDI